MAYTQADGRTVVHGVFPGPSVVKVLGSRVLTPASFVAEGGKESAVAVLVEPSQVGPE